MRVVRESSRVRVCKVKDTKKRTRERGMINCEKVRKERERRERREGEKGEQLLRRQMKEKQFHT